MCGQYPVKRDLRTVELSEIQLLPRLYNRLVVRIKNNRRMMSGNYTTDKFVRRASHILTYVLKNVKFRRTVFEKRPNRQL